jgi:N-methylhydantoinase B/oxoprolinase/acetone carboxylase alpha subunit
MPPTSVNIFEEGANIHSFKIVNNGVFDGKGLMECMVDKPASYPGNSGCRNFRDVESDLKAVSDLHPTILAVLDATYNSANCGKSQGHPAHPSS